jgi:hypothetical protein
VYKPASNQNMHNSEVKINVLRTHPIIFIKEYDYFIEVEKLIA